MKRKVVLLFSLLGLLALEYGCSDNYGDGTPRELIIIGIDETNLIALDSNEQVLGFVEDSAVYNRFKIRTEFIDSFVVVSANFSTACYAEPALPATVSLPLDSVKIRNIATSDSSDITSNFILGYSNSQYTIPITNDSLFWQETRYWNDYRYLRYDLYRVEAPDSASDYKLEITYYAANGDVFRDETKSIIVTP